MGRLEDKVAIVMGGASGLGLAIAHRFVDEGARVTITDINETDGHIAAEKIGAHFVRQDVTDEAGWKNLLATIVRDKGALHLLVATPFLTAYGASKAAVCQLSKSVAIHCAELGNRVRCNSLHPGQVMTPMLEGLLDEVGKAAGQSAETMRGEFLRKIPQGEFQTAEDIANTALYIASDESVQLTG